MSLLNPASVAQGWVCPICRRGVAPSERTCWCGEKNKQTAQYPPPREHPPTTGGIIGRDAPMEPFDLGRKECSASGSKSKDVVARRIDAIASKVIDMSTGLVMDAEAVANLDNPLREAAIRRDERARLIAAMRIAAQNASPVGDGFGLRRACQIVLFENGDEWVAGDNLTPVP